MASYEAEIKKSKFFIIIDSLGNDASVRKAQIAMAKEKGATVISFCFVLPKDFVLHLNSLR